MADLFIAKHGTVTVSPGGIVVALFDFINVDSVEEAQAAAARWAMRQIARDLVSRGLPLDPDNRAVDRFKNAVRALTQHDEVCPIEGDCDKCRQLHADVLELGGMLSLAVDLAAETVAGLRDMLEDAQALLAGAGVAPEPADPAVECRRILDLATIGTAERVRFGRMMAELARRAGKPDEALDYDRQADAFERGEAPR